MRGFRSHRVLHSTVAGPLFHPESIHTQPKYSHVRVQFQIAPVSVPSSIRNQSNIKYFVEMAIKPVGLGFAPDGCGCGAIFPPAGLDMAIKPVDLDWVWVLHPMDAGVEPFFPSTGLPKSDMVIFIPFLQTRQVLETRRVRLQFFTRLYFITCWIFLSRLKLNLLPSLLGGCYGLLREVFYVDWIVDQM
jgi:hypothetical protein